MTADIYSFLSNFKGGGARPNRYQVVLDFPKGVGSTETSRKIGFTCKATAIPSSNMGVIDLPFMGRQIKVPGDKTWDDWNVTVLIDNDFATRDVFEAWHNKILGFQSNVADKDFIDPANVYAKAQVHQLDRADTIVKTYFVEGIFPTSVGEISLGYDSNDQVMEQPVTFAINGWSTSKTS